MEHGLQLPSVPATIPKDLQEAATVYQLGFWQRSSRLELQFGAIPLIWNSMMSWAGGWFFLMAAEQFTLGSNSFLLPGLGSYLQTAANAGNVPALLLGLGTLVAVIVLLDQLLWRPLIAWGDRFKVEQTAGGPAPTSLTLQALGRSASRHAGTVLQFRRSPTSAGQGGGLRTVRRGLHLRGRRRRVLPGG